MFLGLTLLTGIVYPLLITAFAQGIMNRKANGDIIKVDEKAVGARLIAQKFESAKYFWPRPSAIEYNPLPSGGSNLGPTSAALKKAVEERKSSLAKSSSGPIPSEMLFASGSGLDPHITLAGAYFQVERIAKARGIDPQKIKELIERHAEGSAIFGPPHINVLELNLLLDFSSNLL